MHLFALGVLVRWGMCPTAGACHSTSVISLWLLSSTRRKVVGYNYEDSWASEITWMPLVILVPLTPSAAETVNDGVIDLHPTVVTNARTEPNSA